MSRLSNTELKKQLRTLSWNEIEEMLSLLYKESAQANTFFNMHLNPEGFSNELISDYTKKIESCFPMNPHASLHMGEARRLISEVVKLTSSPAITLDLMLRYVECGNNYTQTFGDIDGPFYDSLLSMFNKFVIKLNSLPDDSVYMQLEKRINDLVNDSCGIGWGYSDGIQETVQEIIWRD